MHMHTFTLFVYAYIHTPMLFPLAYAYIHTYIHTHTRIEQFASGRFSLALEQRL